MNFPSLNHILKNKKKWKIQGLTRGSTGLVEVAWPLIGETRSMVSMTGQRSTLIGLGLGLVGRITGRVGPARPGHVSRRQAATWRKWATAELGSTGPVHGVQRGAGPWTTGTVHGGPRPLLPFLSLAHGAPGARGGSGSLSLCLAVVLLVGGELMRSRARVTRQGY